MRFGIKSHYALLAMVDVATHGSAATPVRLSQISERQKLPLPYLEQLFNQLKNSGLITSVRGQKGGYHLSSSATNLSIDQILEAIDEPLHVTRCGNGGAVSCQGAELRCKVHHLWEGLEIHIMDYLAQQKLSDLCRDGLAITAPIIACQGSVP